MLDDVRRQGAAAAKAGLTIWDSPFLHADAMPAHTGEAFLVWDAKVRAWEEGWQRATSARSEGRGALAAAWIRALRDSRHTKEPCTKPRLFCAAGAGTTNDSIATPQKTARQA